MGYLSFSALRKPSGGNAWFRATRGAPGRAGSVDDSLQIVSGKVRVGRGERVIDSVSSRRSASSLPGGTCEDSGRPHPLLCER